MEKKCLNNRNSGFSMVEMLAVVAIIVILLGVSMVSVARYRDLLKITELDNAAREIYMAAENRAVLLSGARRLSDQVGKANGTPTKLSGYGHSNEEKLYYVSKGEVVSKANMTEGLLTNGSVDPALVADGVDFYIVYDQSSGSVTDVFYAEESMSSLVGDDFAAFYDKWAKSRSERLKLKDQMLVGWYNGQAAEGRDEKKDFPEEPWIRVIIENGEELTVRVEYGAPADAVLELVLRDDKLTKSISLPKNRYLGGEPLGVTVKDGEVTVPAGTGSFTWVLDSLEEGEGQFKDLADLDSIVIPGADFAVEGTITPKDSGSFTAASDSDANNSLFQKGSGGESAGIGYLRHLQNLDTAFSGVTGKTSAVQTADIYCHGDKAFEAYKGYNFIPIWNDELTSYTSQYVPESTDCYKIYDLYIENPGKNAGLFSEVWFDMSFWNIRLVNARVDASGDIKPFSAGALVGMVAADTVVDNCWVYWEPTVLRDIQKGVEGGGDEYDYQIKGQTAGGLIGHIHVSEGQVTITNSLAATLVYGELSAGGLIGAMEAGSTAKVTRSYADCYLKADPASETGGGGAAGLIGSVGGTTTLIDCYAAGYIMDGSQAAGLCLGAGTTGATNVYSVMRYPERTLTAQFTYLTQNQGSDIFENTYFLYSETKDLGLTDGKKISGVSYDEMSGSEFVKTMGTSFQRKDQANSHPYELRVPLDIYNYPGLVGLPHYGDWGSELAALSLVYYENDGSTNWVSGIGVRDLDDSTTSVTVDGYALLLRKKDGDNGKTVTVKYSYLDKDGVAKEITKEYTLTGAREIEADEKKDWYYVLPLPEDLITSDYAEEQFFRYIQFALTKPGEDTPYEGDAFFNPHFAEAVQTARLEGEGAEGGWSKDKVTAYANALAKAMDHIKVRTPRHLCDLSRFKEYYHQSYVYRQMLDLNYATYTGYNLFSVEPYLQQPIGSGKSNDAFEGTYDGGCHMIEGVVPDAKETAQRQYAGLFGYSRGTLRNIVYQLDAEKQVEVYLGNSAQNLYVGALAGGSEGLIDNCAVFGVNLQAGASAVNLYVGGLVGWNGGTIRNSAAELAQLSADCLNYASVYAGGLVGENGASRDIYTSYAVGRISAIVDKTIETARICGFVGWNYGSIANSYAAVDLSSGGDNVEAYGFCGMRNGSQSGNVYLNEGNYTYRDISYAAKYERSDDRAQPIVYTNLTKADSADSTKSDAVPGMGLGGEVWSKTDTYPYPAVVRDRSGAYIHYGEYPVPMPLGDMGVFYWEKLVNIESGEATYHMSALAVDPKEGAKTITKQSTLSDDHNDGKVVTDYGYGYYASRDVEKNVKLTVENIGYTQYIPWDKRKSNGTAGELPDVSSVSSVIKNPTDEDAVNSVRDPVSKKKEDDAAEGLNKLNTEYNFHCWNSYHEGARAASGATDNDRGAIDTAGLVLFKRNQTNDEKAKPLDVNSGTFTLEQGNLKVTFIVNPQFADSMAVKFHDGLQVVNRKKDNSDAIVEDIGKNPGTESNPYQVRCGTQLQEINWHDTIYTDVPLDTSGKFVVDRFPYLNGKVNEETYHWKQTHDIDWTAEGNTYQNSSGTQPGVFFAIAQGRANGTSLPGWFGGHYDGQNYTIKNLNIGINAQQYEVNCMGLFGVVRNATLENIVMYSESGQDMVTVEGRYGGGQHNNLGTGNASDRWYAGGVLVGLARNSEISNCSVAGYTIRDKTIYARSVQERNNGNSYYTMGGAIGGLVGMTDAEMKGCTAAATIEIVCDHQNDNGGASAPIRVGGLVGSTTARVTDCYTGGEIVTSIQDENGKTVQAQNATVYAGRIIGGVGMGPFNVEDADGKEINSETNALTVTVSNCYSYLTLPDSVQTRYNIGGNGRANSAPAGTVTTTRDYYYGDDVGAGGGEKVTYRQLAGQDDITSTTDPNDTRKIYSWLTDYSPVTSELGGVAVGGRYSYAPESRPELQGLDYPFPTVLTQPGNLHVHYGGWPLRGMSPLILDCRSPKGDRQSNFFMPGEVMGWPVTLSAHLMNGKR